MLFYSTAYLARSADLVIPRRLITKSIHLLKEVDVTEVEISEISHGLRVRSPLEVLAEFTKHISFETVRFEVTDTPVRALLFDLAR